MAPLLPPAMAPRVPAPLLSVSESGRRRRRPSARSRLSAAAILGSQEPPRERARSVHAQRSHRPTASESEPRLHRRRGDPPLRTPPAPRPPSAAAAAAGPGGPSCVIQALVHEDRSVLWPRSWVPGTMAAALSWRSPSTFSTWRGPFGWTISCDKHQPSSTEIFLEHSAK